MNVWIGAGIAVAAGLVVGTIAGRVVQAWMSRESNPDVMRRIAPSIGSLVFSLILITGLMVALGMVQRESLDQISADFVAFVPKVISGAIVIIAANVAGQFAQQALERTLSRLPGSAARNIPNITRLVIFAFGAILAAAQLGVDTSIINIARSATSHRACCRTTLTNKIEQRVAPAINIAIDTHTNFELKRIQSSDTANQLAICRQ